MTHVYVLIKATVRGLATRNRPTLHIHLTKRVIVIAYSTVSDELYRKPFLSPRAFESREVQVEDEHKPLSMIAAKLAANLARHIDRQHHHFAGAPDTDQRNTANH